MLSFIHQLRLLRFVNPIHFLSKAQDKIHRRFGVQFSIGFRIWDEWTMWSSYITTTVNKWLNFLLLSPDWNRTGGMRWPCFRVMGNYLLIIQSFSKRRWARNTAKPWIPWLTESSQYIKLILIHFPLVKIDSETMSERTKGFWNVENNDWYLSLHVLL